MNKKKLYSISDTRAFKEAWMRRLPPTFSVLLFQVRLLLSIFYRSETHTLAFKKELFSQIFYIFKVLLKNNHDYEKTNSVFNLITFCSVDYSSSITSRCWDSKNYIFGILKSCIFWPFLFIF